MSVLQIQQAIARADALYNAGRFADSISAYRDVLKLQPDNPQALNNLGNALKNAKQFAESADCYRRAIVLRPDVPELHYNLASVLMDAGQFDEAITEFEICLRERPNYADAHRNYANALRCVARLGDAADHLRSAGAISDLLYLSHFLPESDAKSLFEAHRQWGSQFPEPSKHAPRILNNRLRIGYVSPDFREHCQANFLMPLLANHDKSRFEIFAYCNMPTVDQMGERLLAHVNHRRSIAGVNDANADAMIRADRIDILVDLTLHMADNRLPLFARKPAPVQISWLGYPSTTGLTAIDYRLSDPYLDPPGETEAFYVEKTIRLPDTFWCYDPMNDVPAIAAPPSERAGYITFGCLNNFAKVTDATLNLWGRVMQGVPNSRLILLAPSGSARRRVINSLAKHDVAVGRLCFIDRLPRQDYLLMYHQIDFGLDTIPCTGHTTTLDALWMATPVVTCTGPTAISRGAASILHCAGFDELITHNADDFVKCAIDLASNPNRLREIRSDLRERFERSPLMDAVRFTRNIESVYEQVTAE
jgi:protein O-GlcNAc transferase